MRGLLILLRWPIRGWLHRRCLRRIARLERELGIGVPVISPKTDWLVVDEEFRIEPGVRWPVESNNHVQIISTAWEL